VRSKEFHVRLRRFRFVLVTLFVALAIGDPRAGNSTPKPWTAVEIGSFPSEPTGLYPMGALIADAHGVFYGVTLDGGSNPDGTCDGGCGTVYALASSGLGNRVWTRTVLYAFKGYSSSDGSEPLAGVISDASGALYGTTFQGGISGPNGLAGVVYKLTPPAPGQTAWSESILYEFSGPDGELPAAALVMDAHGALYGTTQGGGSGGQGVVFSLTPPSPGGTTWTQTVLHAFSGGPDGSQPQGSLLLDTHGDVYGTTSGGGGNGNGNVFELMPPASGQTAWTENVLYAFSGGADGKAPQSNLIADARGDLYGTASSGGADGDGVVFELRPSRAGGAWTERVLHTFAGGTDGANPGNLVADPAGTLFGSTGQGGDPNCVVNPNGCGTAYKLTPGAHGWVELVLHAFAGGADGYYPGPMFWYRETRARAAISNFERGRPTSADADDSRSALYGTTCCGGNANSAGTVYKLSH
jgi:uncharacterized repeat protein (TIGR03803 family)